jgi:hypothetical protein
VPGVADAGTALPVNDAATTSEAARGRNSRRDLSANHLAESGAARPEAFPPGLLIRAHYTGILRINERYVKIFAGIAVSVFFPGCPLPGRGTSVRRCLGGRDREVLVEDARRVVAALEHAQPGRCV